MNTTLEKPETTVETPAADSGSDSIGPPASASRPSLWKRFRSREKKSLRPSEIKLTYYKLFWIFFIGSFIGVVIETLWCLATRHHYESRVGVVFGPFNPVYGFGAVLMTVALKWLSEKRDLWIFLGSMVIGGAFEYICSLFQELVFGTVSWEYSNTQFNFAGRTNIMYAFFWGLLGLLWVKELLPRLSALIDRIPRRLGVWLTAVLTVFMILNILISGLAVQRQTQRRMNMPATNLVSVLLDRYFPDEVLDRIYPNMMVVEELEQ